MTVMLEYHIQALFRIPERAKEIVYIKYELRNYFCIKISYKDNVGTKTKTITCEHNTALLKRLVRSTKSMVVV